jgi:hypothetical protein
LADSIWSRSSVQHQNYMFEDIQLCSTGFCDDSFHALTQELKKRALV